MSKSLVSGVQKQAPGFRLGLKQIFLPQHVITFHRRDRMGPNFANFEVPLRFTKFDLRDYLWNLYGVDTKSIRSSVQHSPVERRRGGRGGFTRSPPKKFMIAELTEPFVWPEVPEDLTSWNHELYTAREEAQKKMKALQWERHKGNITPPTQRPKTMQKRALKQRAADLLKGKIKWETDAKFDQKWVAPSKQS